VSATPAVIVTSTPDGGLGKPVDFTLITQEDGVTSADRQAVSIGDPQQGGQRAGVTSDSALVVEGVQRPIPILATERTLRDILVLLQSIDGRLATLETTNRGFAS
jgi:hypothetical protein